jgi:hypothetical protein
MTMSGDPFDKDDLGEALKTAPLAEQRPWTAWIGLAVRSIARLWVVCLLVAVAVSSGIALNQMFSARAELDTLRESPGPDAYAIVAYRAELRRQLDAYRRDRGADATPTPPARPRLVEEIDIARLRNTDNIATASSSQRGGPANRTTPLVRAPD